MNQTLNRACRYVNVFARIGPSAAPTTEIEHKGHENCRQYCHSCAQNGAVIRIRHFCRSDDSFALWAVHGRREEREFVLVEHLRALECYRERALVAQLVHAREEVDSLELLRRNIRMESSARMAGSRVQRCLQRGEALPRVRVVRVHPQHVWPHGLVEYFPPAELQRAFAHLPDQTACRTSRHVASCGSPQVRAPSSCITRHAIECLHGMAESDK